MPAVSGPPSEPCVLAPGLRRLTAPNPSAYTYTGTQTYLVGTDKMAVIDPGPAMPEHLARIGAAAGGARITAILVTHNHRDHSPGAALLAQATGAPIVGCAPLSPQDAGGGLDAAFDGAYRPDRVLADGEVVAGAGWTLRAVATPGHSSNHLAFAWEETGALFSGDHVMGWSTSVVAPPDGDMGAYMQSLEKLAARADRIYYPGHGEPVEAPARLVRGMIGHRRQREGQILRLLERGERAVPAMVSFMYAGLDPKLLPAARMSVLAHLHDLRRRGLAEGAADDWRLAA